MRWFKSCPPHHVPGSNHTLPVHQISTSSHEVVGRFTRLFSYKVIQEAVFSHMFCLQTHQYVILGVKQVMHSCCLPKNKFLLFCNSSASFNETHCNLGLAASHGPHCSSSVFAITQSESVLQDLSRGLTKFVRNISIVRIIITITPIAKYSFFI